jgi:hypothetical protein
MLSENFLSGLKDIFKDPLDKTTTDHPPFNPEVKKKDAPEVRPSTGPTVHYDDMTEFLTITKGRFEDDNGEIPNATQQELVTALEKDRKQLRRQGAYKGLNNKHFNHVFYSKVSEIFGPRIANLLMQ